MRVCGGVVKVPLTKELLNECATACSQYGIFLEDERKKKEKTKQRDKRKGDENELGRATQETKNNLNCVRNSREGCR